VGDLPGDLPTTARRVIRWADNGRAQICFVHENLPFRSRSGENESRAHRVTYFCRIPAITASRTCERLLSRRS
jgi:hypothetical protein